MPLCFTGNTTTLYNIFQYHGGKFNDSTMAAWLKQNDTFHTLMGLRDQSASLYLPTHEVARLRGGKVCNTSHTLIGLWDQSASLYLPTHEVARLRGGKVYKIICMKLMIYCNNFISTVSAYSNTLREICSIIS